LENDNNNHILSFNHISKFNTSETAINFYSNAENTNSTEKINNQENSFNNKLVSRPTPNYIKVFNAKKKLKQSFNEYLEK